MKSIPNLEVVSPDIKNNTNKKQSNTSKFVFSGVSIILLVIASLFYSPEKLSTGKDSSKLESTRTERLWYAGGTLHSSTTVDWRLATYENKLATCADWAATIIKSKGLSYNDDLAAMKRDATEILACIDEVAKESTLNLKLTEVVSSCAILMKLL